jgi:hypothetical protein
LRFETQLRDLEFQQSGTGVHMVPELLMPSNRHQYSPRHHDGITQPKPSLRSGRTGIVVVSSAEEGLVFSAFDHVLKDKGVCNTPHAPCR